MLIHPINFMTLKKEPYKYHANHREKIEQKRLLLTCLSNHLLKQEFQTTYDRREDSSRYRFYIKFK